MYKYLKLKKKNRIEDLGVSIGVHIQLLKNVAYLCVLQYFFMQLKFWAGHCGNEGWAVPTHPLYYYVCDKKKKNISAFFFIKKNGSRF